MPLFRRKAFTLIELLVVIAIIAILAAILFPVFAQAKAAAKHSSNISNIKQLAVAALMYANDYDDTFVSQVWNYETSPAKTDEYSILFQPYIKNWGILYDPFRTNDCNSYGNTWGDGTNRCKGYGVNMGIMSWGNPTGMFDTHQWLYTPTRNVLPGRSMTFYPEPANMVMLGTTADEPMYTMLFEWQRLNGAPGQSVFLKEPRNGGKWVWSYVDGHAKTVFYGAYTAPGYSYLVMPKSGEDMKRMCYDVNVMSGARTCQGWIDWLLTSRTKF